MGWDGKEPEKYFIEVNQHTVGVGGGRAVCSCGFWPARMMRKDRLIFFVAMAMVCFLVRELFNRDDYRRTATGATKSKQGRASVD